MTSCPICGSTTWRNDDKGGAPTKCWHPEIKNDGALWCCGGCGVGLGDTEEQAKTARLEDIAGICGCGSPERSHRFLGRFLWILDSDNEAKGWTGDVEALVRECPEDAAELIMQWASELRLTEHGSVVPGWTDERGRLFLKHYREGKT